MADYRDRVAGDLDHWIAAGLVPASNREAILATLPARRRLDAVTALIWVAGVLLGLAVIAFIAANWEGIPRLVRFVLLLGTFLAAAIGGAWFRVEPRDGGAGRGGRALASDVLLTIASLVFASAVGLTGQIFEITGNPPAVPYGAGAAALALGVVGRSRGALAVGVVAVLIGDFILIGDLPPIPASLIVAPVALALALRWRSAFLANIASVALLGVVLWFVLRYDVAGWGLVLVALVLALGAAGLAVAQRRFPNLLLSASLTRVPLSWFVVGALGFFIIGGYSGDFTDNTALGLVHRVAWIAASAGLIAYGRFDRQGVLTGIGVLSLIGACCALLHDLGLNLIVISLVFLFCSFAALVVGLVLRRQRPTGDPR